MQKAFLSDGKFEYDPSDTIEVEDIIYGYNRWKVCNDKDFYLSWKDESAKDQVAKEINDLLLLRSDKITKNML